MPSPTPSRRNYHRALRISWWTFGVLWGLFFLLIFSIRLNLFGYFGEIPSFEVLENPDSEVASEVYSIDGKLMGKYFSSTNRSPVPFDDISKPVVKALIATEDERFEAHSGIDMRSTFRSIFGLLTGSGSAGGGSTISQQLAKNLFKMREAPPYVGGAYEVKGLGMLTIKIKEWITAMRLEDQYTKEEILTMYLNTVDWVHNATGIRSASQTYFGKEPGELEVKEAALLVGMLKNPSYFNPVRFPDRAKERRNVVMAQMEKNDFLEPDERAELATTELDLHFQPESYAEGIAPYFRGMIREELNEWCAENGYDLTRDGLKVYTTIDSRMQQYAEESMVEHMKSLQPQLRTQWGKRDPWPAGFLEKAIEATDLYRELKKELGSDKAAIDKELRTPRPTTVFTWQGPKDTTLSPLEEFRFHRWLLQSGFMAMDPQTGSIKAWVGGIDPNFFQLDHVRQTRRQPGSTFKPILYSYAMMQGFTPCDEIPDAPVTIQSADNQFWQPKGYDYSGEPVTLKLALAQSKNNIAAKLMDKVGVENVIGHARKLGIQAPLDPVLSLALGTSDVSVYEMVGAYATFVNQGVHTEPMGILRIEDRRGRVLAEFQPVRSQAMDKFSAYLTVVLLRGGAELAGGTSTRLRTDYKLLEGGNQIGGKTGTTQKSTDGWYMGISPYLVAGCWVGAEDNYLRILSGSLGQGSRMAMPIFGRFMQKVYADRSLGIKRGIFPSPELSPEQIRSITCQDDGEQPMDPSVLQQYGPIQFE